MHSQCCILPHSMLYDFELLRYNCDSILRCALMYKIEGQVWFPAGMNKVQCYRYSTYCCAWDDMIQHVLSELNLPHCARRPVKKDHSSRAPWRESGGRSLALSLSRLCSERCTTHRAVCDIIRQWTYTPETECTAQRLHRQNTGRSTCDCLYNSAHGRQGPRHKGPILLSTQRALSFCRHKVKGPSFCQHKGPILLSTWRDPSFFLYRVMHTVTGTALQKMDMGCDYTWEHGQVTALGDMDHDCTWRHGPWLHLGTWTSDCTWRHGPWLH